LARNSESLDDFLDFLRSGASIDILMRLGAQVEVNVETLQKSDTYGLEHIHNHSSHIIRNHEDDEHWINLSL
jgi:hypothetical protein